MSDFPTTVDIDQGMQMALNSLRHLFEPGSVDLQHAHDKTMVEMSTAMSLKRIADNMNECKILLAGAGSSLNGIGDATSHIAAAIKTNNNLLETLRQAIHSLEYEIRSNTGRELKITIAKD